MIGRVWKGWATAENAGAYEELFRERILPGLRDIDGFVGAYVLRRDSGDEVEITTLTLFGSMEAIRAFAGEDPTKAHARGEASPLPVRGDGCPPPRRRSPASRLVFRVPPVPRRPDSRA
jgi:heme-degrading monooxygenase HmoA